MADKIKCLINNQVHNLTPRAFRVAEKFYGAERLDKAIAQKPIELSRPLVIPKILKKAEPVIAELSVPEPVIEPKAEIKPKANVVVEAKEKEPQTVKKEVKKPAIRKKK
jgi:hypothetical protein